MYEQFYGLKEKPFNMTPDPEYLFFTEKHKEAFAHLVYGIRERRGFIEITGEVGAGKTTLCRALINEFDEDTRIALVLNPFLSEIELIRTINEELFIDSNGATKKELLDTLNHYLIEQHSKGKNVVVVIDEAQNLPIETLEQVRLISNLETVKAKLLQIVLVGQPELREKLSQPELRQLNQRITVRNHISCLSRQETEEYIRHRLSIAGSNGDIVFTKKAMDEIHDFSKGLPRAINVLCDHALLTGYVQETFTIDDVIVKKVRAEITGPAIKHRRKAGSGGLFGSPWKGALAGAAAAVLIMGVGLAGYALLGTDANTRSPQLSASAQASVPASSIQDLVPDADSAAPSLPVDPAVNKAAKSEPEAIAPASAVSKDEPHSDEVMLASAKPPEPALPTELAVKAPDAPAPPPVEPVNAAPPVADSPLSPGPAIAVAGAFDKDRVLRCDAVTDTFDAALLTAMGQWGLPENDALAAYASLAAARGAGMANPGAHPQRQELLTRLGFSLAPVRVNLAMIRQIDLPCLLQTYREDLYVPEFVVLAGAPAANPNQILVDNPRIGRVVYDAAELKNVWFGHCLFVVPGVALPTVLIAEGSPAEDVRMLQIKLQRLGYFQGEITGAYGSSTRQAVMGLQRDKRIRVDGLVGPETGLLLFASLAGPQTPRLSASHLPENAVRVALASPPRTVAMEAPVQPPPALISPRPKAFEPVTEIPASEITETTIDETETPGTDLQETVDADEAMIPEAARVINEVTP